MSRPVPLAGPDVLLRAVETAGRDAAASLLALEDHAGLRFLRTVRLTGEAAQRRDEVLATVAAMHADLARHRDVVARARAARGTRPRPAAREVAAVVELLRGPSVLVEEAMPLPRRGLDGPVVTRHLTPATLLARVRAAFAAVAGDVARAAAVWDAVALALDPLDVALDRARDALAALTDPRAGGAGLAARRAAVEEARAAVTAARHDALADPLARDPRRPVDPKALAALGDRVGALREDADAAVRARDDRPARRRRLAEALDDVEAEVSAATVAARAYRRGPEGGTGEVAAGARPSDGSDADHRRVDRAQPGPRV